MERGKSMPRPGTVDQLRQNWAVFEDEAFATRIQEQEVTQHYHGNRHRNQQIREDLPQARQVQSIEEAEAQQQIEDHRRKMQELAERDEILARDLQSAREKDYDSTALYEAKRDEVFAQNLQRIEQDYLAKKKGHRQQDANRGINTKVNNDAQNSLQEDESFHDLGGGFKYNDRQYRTQIARPAQVTDEPVYQNTNALNQQTSVYLSDENNYPLGKMQDLNSYEDREMFNLPSQSQAQQMTKYLNKSLRNPDTQNNREFTNSEHDSQPINKYYRDKESYNLEKDTHNLESNQHGNPASQHQANIISGANQQNSPVGQRYFISQNISTDSGSGGRLSTASSRSRSSTTSTSASDMGAVGGMPYSDYNAGACGGATSLSFSSPDPNEVLGIGTALTSAELKAAEDAERMFEQEKKDMEMAKQLQEQMSLENIPQHAEEDQRLAIEAQDREFAKILHEKEKAKLRRAKEKARLRKLEKQQLSEAAAGCESQGEMSINQQSIASTELLHLASTSQIETSPLHLHDDKPISPRSPQSPDIQPPSRKPYIHAEAIDSHTNDTYCQKQINPAKQKLVIDEPQYANIGDNGQPLKEEPILHIPTSLANGMHSPRQPSVLDTDMPIPPYMPMQSSTTKKSASLERRIKKKKEKEGCKQQ